MSDLPAQIERHVRQYFEGHEVMARIWPVGPMKDSHPGFQVLEFAPGPRSALWNYELMTMTAWYHTRHRLGLGHTMPIGEPWVSGASCDHFLVSRPYPYGPDLELVPIGAEHVPTVVFDGTG